MIGKFFEAKKNNQREVQIWGTGHASREFFYVEDAAKDIITAVEKYDKPEPLNLGTGDEITILDLAKTIARKVGFEGELVFDIGITDGQPHRCMNIDKARNEFPLCPKISLEKGLDKTIEWFITTTRER